MGFASPPGISAAVLLSALLGGSTSTIDVDATLGRYSVDGRSYQSLDTALSVLGGSLAGPSAQSLDDFDNSVLGLRVEEQVRNEAYSTSGQGAVAGALGSGGALPTGWHTTNYAIDGTLALTITPLANGRIRLSFVGTPATSNVFAIQCNPIASAVAAVGDVWTNSFQLQQIGAAAGFSEIHCGIIERDASGNFLNSNHRLIFPQTDIPFPHEYTRTLTQAARVCGKLEVKFTAGTAVSATYEIGNWMLTKNSFRASFVPSVNGATRLADLITTPNAATSGTVVIEANVPRNVPTGTLWQLDDGTANNRVSLRTAGYVLYLTAVSGGTTIADLKLGRVIPWSKMRVAFAFTPTAVVGSLNGKPGVASGAITLPALNRRVIGSGVSGFWNAAIARFSVLTRAADVNEVRNLSRPPHVYDDFDRADGAIGSAPTGHPWTSMAPSGARVQMTVAGGKGSTPASGQSNTIAYAGTDFAAVPKALYASAAWSSNASAGGVTLIANPNGLTSVNNILAGSLHIIYGLVSTTVGYFVNSNFIVLNTVYYAALPADNTIRSMGWRVVGNALIVLLPDGSLDRYVSAPLIGGGGRFATWECTYNTSAAGPDFYAIQIER